ncbi:Hypothetical_protein [Hexamita inflata]|uniref:Hypothetical_protein n=1 Tax=Hexamita inflata TaxID=28002 RepID=A0AA86PR90_9EUKA|nr:Hypothetical protein HINF_LOCUS31033 [Hexamita inflata]
MPPHAEITVNERTNKRTRTMDPTRRRVVTIGGSSLRQHIIQKDITDACFKINKANLLQTSLSSKELLKVSLCIIVKGDKSYNKSFSVTLTEQYSDKENNNIKTLSTINFSQLMNQ